MSDPIDVIQPHRTARSSLQGVVLHRPRDLLDLRPSRRAGIPTCGLLRSGCDLGAVDRDGVHPFVGYIVTNGLASPFDLERALLMHSRRGRHGICAFREALADWIVDGKLLDSELERLMKNTAKRYHLPPMQFHAIIEGFEVDFWVTGTPIVVECDGWEFHDQRRNRFERDRRVRAELAAAGYIVVEFTYTMLKRQPHWVATKITQAVERWRTELPTIWVPTVTNP